MFFEEGDRGELLISFARFAVDFNEALELCQFLKGISACLADMEDVSELNVRDDFGLDVLEGDELVGDDDVLEFSLNGCGFTLQIGQELFLLMTRIL
jgi:hypothetical protein